MRRWYNFIYNNGQEKSRSQRIATQAAHQVQVLPGLEGKVHHYQIRLWLGEHRAGTPNIRVPSTPLHIKYRLTSIHDGTYTDHPVNCKSWFHFCVSGFPKNTKGKFLVTKIQTIMSVYYVHLPSPSPSTIKPIVLSSKSEKMELGRD